MKSKEEIQRLSYAYSDKVNMSKDMTSLSIADAVTYGYNQCQEDMAKEFEKDGAKLFKSEIRRAYIHGQGNAQGMAAGLERDEVEDYTNWRMLSLTKK